MGEAKIVRIDVRDEINKFSAEGTMAKIRAAIRNDAQKIRLEFSPECDIHSAEFLSFLRITDNYMRSKNTTLELVGCNENLSNLLSIARLGTVIGGRPAVENEREDTSI